jgi:hypothetical protein
VVIGDHGHKNIHHRININAAFRPTGWKAWANACEGSAQIALAPPADPNFKQRVKEILRGIKFRGEPAIKAIFEGEQIRRLHLSEDIDLVAEACDGYAFTHFTEGQVLQEAGERRRSVHGYLPDADGYGPVFLGKGGSLKEGYRQAAARSIDLGPTLAALLGVELPDADGKILHDLLRHRAIREPAG